MEVTHKQHKAKTIVAPVKELIQTFARKSLIFLFLTNADVRRSTLYMGRSFAVWNAVLQFVDYPFPQLPHILLYVSLVTNGIGFGRETGL